MKSVGLQGLGQDDLVVGSAGPGDAIRQDLRDLVRAELLGRPQRTWPLRSPPSQRRRGAARTPLPICGCSSSVAFSASWGLSCGCAQSHDRRRILHVNVTKHPTSGWIPREYACGMDNFAVFRRAPIRMTIGSLRTFRSTAAILRIVTFVFIQFQRTSGLSTSCLLYGRRLSLGHFLAPLRFVLRGRDPCRDR
jgi:hypothetical protein